MNLSTGTPISQLPTGTIDGLSAVFPLTINMTGTPQTIRASLQQAAQFFGIADSNGGRLSLVSGTAVPTTDQTAKTVIWFVPHISDKLSLYNGATWVDATINSPSVAVPSIATGTFDIFAYDNGGSVALETLNWTNDTTRATALAVQNGRRVKSGDATRRYLGTGRTTTSSGQCEDSIARRFLWNNFNQVERILKKVDTTANWLVTGSSPLRPWNNTTANRVELVIGVSEEPVYLEFLGLHSVAAGGTANVGIGLDSTSVNSADVSPASNSTSSVLTIAFAKYRSIPAAGYHFLQLLEFANSASNTTFYGLVAAFGGQSGAVGYLDG